jgi:hypothetical protein
VAQSPKHQVPPPSWKCSRFGNQRPNLGKSRSESLDSESLDSEAVNREAMQIE